MQVTCTELWFLLQELLDETLGAHTCGVRGGGHWGGGLVAFGPQDWAGQRPSGRSSPYKAHSPKLAPQVRCGIHGLAQPEPDTLCLSQGKKKNQLLGEASHSPSEKRSRQTKICHSCFGQGFFQPLSVGWVHFSFRWTIWPENPRTCVYIDTYTYTA